MPELPEVETTRRGIAPHILHHPITAVTLRHTQLRWPIDKALSRNLPGRTLVRADRRGKYLLLAVDDGRTLIWHLGMSGSLRIVEPTEPPGKHDHIDLRFAHGRVLRYHDPRRFGAFLATADDPAQHALICHLGPEPLTDDFNGEYLYERSRKRSTAVKSWIMDSRVVVGVGNIYANESLFLAKIHPLRAAGKLTRPACHRLADIIKAVLARSITQGGTTLRDFVGGDGKPGYFAQQLNVYGRGGEPCPVCAKPLTEKPLSQRTTVYCTHCQN
ncbi:DNA-formamidopyrimidine glycosylase [Teredinibacter turnerae T7901]|uniref:Formamidopyrimidine-DNA glycosylase n=1 Tax=Teredinibacter turnerae (strain ATCC 39867 / T7901) TaxID=377629 RepID=FPG_TERTT|nr:bifunctional DNA-formamidopyrimidine glycosylase/DNA-(apurinic or apyrimidinic site) lyase [Teredinibacter turnerae]C5BLG1.1 RecName: Full=Formamidopyrimidine-DNA glycosylase; Short=Fapy-DNA glycosylase; AltName: Full=DNA-(apurinic or apyrimidinic site) lyase MutM; Short=AP lyase MutM [Teredinibacter turnerae T7901]ACR12438.1 DNA-formamidopyrimidine glycosylase [Teredinibacter turnerae T7901]